MGTERSADPAGTLAGLLAELEGFKASWEADEEPDGVRVSAALVGARELAPALDEGQGALLSAAVEGAISAADERYKRLAGKLKELSEGRRAVKGYGSLKSNKQGQKIRVKA